MTGEPAAACLQEMFGAVLSEVRGYATQHLDGAFPEPRAAEAARKFTERILGIADAYEKAGHSTTPRGSASRPRALPSASHTPA